MIKTRGIIISFLLFCGIVSQAQTGYIHGYVTQSVNIDSTDEIKTDTLLGASVQVLNTIHEAYSLPEYLIEDIPAGIYKVRASSLDGVYDKTMDSVVVVAGDTTHLDIEVGISTFTDPDEIILVYELEKVDEAANDQAVFETDEAKTSVTEKDISRGGASDVAGTSKNITGVSVVGGKYVYVRGLSDRYTKTLLNNAEIPGLDPNKNSVQLDMFPSAFVGSIDVIKTYSPEFPADWGGGLLDIKTKSYPDSFSVSLKIGASYNRRSSFQKDFLTYEGGSTDFLGFDDGTRAVPDYVQGLIDNDQLELLDRLPIDANREAYSEAIESFNKTMQPSTKLSAINHNFVFTIGDKKIIKNKKDTLAPRTIGYFAGASYKRDYSYFDDGVKGKYQLTSSIEDVSSLVTNRSLGWERGRETVLFGSLVNLKYKHSNDHNIGINYIHNHSGISTASVTTGFTDEDPGITFRNQQLGYLERAMNSVQLYGNHTFHNRDSLKIKQKRYNSKISKQEKESCYKKCLDQESSKQGRTTCENECNAVYDLSLDSLNSEINKKDKIVVANKRTNFQTGEPRVMELDWTGTYTLASQEEPDLRYVTDDFSENDSGEQNYRFSSIYNAPARYFRSMKEFNLDHKANFMFPIEIDSAKVLEVKLGVSNVTKIRQFNEVRFDITTNGEYNGDFEDYLSDDQLGYVDDRFQVGLLDLSSDKNNYLGFSSITGGYLKLKYPITPRLDFVGGVRDEYTIITVESEDVRLPKGELIRNDVLPSLNFNYLVWDGSDMKKQTVTRYQGDSAVIDTVFHEPKMKVRFGFNRTLARPNFRELAPYATEDYDLGYVLIGNSDLDRTLIDNLDIKWEFLPREKEAFSVAAFYKRFTNPIELLVNVEAANDEFQWRQVPRADLVGIEMDFKKYLDFISPKLSTTKVGANLSLVYSQIEIEEQELNNIKVTDVDHADTRPLFGQSPYLANAYIEFEPDTSRQSPGFRKTAKSKITRGMSFVLNYNVFGERLVLVTSGGTPDVYELPRHSLDFSIKKQFTKSIGASLRFKNILNASNKQVYKFKGDSEEYQEFNDQDFVFSEYRRGVSISGSFTLKF